MVFSLYFYNVYDTISTCDTMLSTIEAKNAIVGSVGLIGTNQGIRGYVMFMSSPQTNLQVGELELFLLKELCFKAIVC